MIKDQKPVVIKNTNKQKKLDRRLMDFLKYRELFGKKRSDDDISDQAISQWEGEGKDCSKWLLVKEK